MLLKVQDKVLRAFHPARKLAWPLLIVGALSFPGMVLLAVVRPDLDTDLMYIGWVAGLGVLMLGILMSMSRPESLPKQGLVNRLLRIWESLVFLMWLICLVVFLSLAVKIITFTQ